MKEEYAALIVNGTWELCDLPEGRSAIKCKWVYKIKLNVNEETYAPDVCYSSLRYLFALAARLDMKVDQMDAITAFLQGELSEEIYMEQPPCFVDGKKKKKVCRLRKALYGLKQSSRVWNKKLDAALRKLELVCTDYDPCVYTKVRGEKMLFVAVYVDDVLIFSNCDRWKEESSR